MVYEIAIKFPGYDGTLELLVEQVRRFEVDILDVRLSDVVERVREALSVDYDLHKFTPVYMVSKLLYLKSRNLLPGQDQFEETDLIEEDERQDDEEETTRVRERLEEMYRAFSETGAKFRDMIDENTRRLRSYQTRAGELPGFIDELAYIEEITPFDLLLTMSHIIKRSLEDHTYHVNTDPAQQLNRRISEIFDFLLNRTGSTIFFSDIVSEKPEKPEAVLSFLAVVYLVSQERIEAVQNTPYGDIHITIKETTAA